MTRKGGRWYCYVKLFELLEFKSLLLGECLEVMLFLFLLSFFVVGDIRGDVARKLITELLQKQGNFLLLESLHFAFDPLRTAHYVFLLRLQLGHHIRDILIHSTRSNRQSAGV